VKLTHPEAHPQSPSLTDAVEKGICRIVVATVQHGKPTRNLGSNIQLAGFVCQTQTPPLRRHMDSHGEP
jgi:hypothetical protein